MVAKLIEELKKIEDTEPSIDAYSQTRILDEFDLSTITCEFVVGDWVTPREKSSLKGAGEPHKVLNTFKDLQWFMLDCSQPLRCYNMIVSCVMYGVVKIYAVMSTDFEKYTGPVYPEYE